MVTIATRSAAGPPLPLPRTKHDVPKVFCRTRSGSHHRLLPYSRGRGLSETWLNTVPINSSQ